MQISNPNLFAEVRSGNNGRGSEEGYSVQSGKSLGNLSVQHANYKMKTVSEALGHWATKTSKGQLAKCSQVGLCKQQALGRRSMDLLSSNEHSPALL